MVAYLEAQTEARFSSDRDELGPIAATAAQIAIVFALVWSLGAVAGLELRPILGMFPLVLVFGSLVLTPRNLILSFPISISMLGVFAISIGSSLWTIDPLATSAIIRGLVPSLLAIVLAAGILPAKKTITSLIWTIRIIYLITFFALIAMPATRAHVSGEVGVADYPGWHGLFNHKNNMSAFLVLAIPTILTYHRPGAVKVFTLTLTAILIVGSTSGTGLSAAFFVVMVWLWLRVYLQQDAQNSSLLMSISVLGTIGAIVGALSSLATITSAYGKDTSFSGRTEIWEASLDALARKPLLGHGYSALFFREHLSSETTEIWRQVGFEASHAHNGLLDAALQIGLIGLGIIIVLLASTFSSGWKAMTTNPDLGIWVVSFLTAMFLMSFSEDVLYGGWFGVFALMKMLLMKNDTARKSSFLRAE